MIILLISLFTQAAFGWALQVREKHPSASLVRRSLSSWNIGPALLRQPHPRSDPAYHSAALRNLYFLWVSSASGPYLAELCLHSLAPKRAVALLFPGFILECRSAVPAWL